MEKVLQNSSGWHFALFIVKNKLENSSYLKDEEFLTPSSPPAVIISAGVHFSPVRALPYHRHFV